MVLPVLVTKGNVRRFSIKNPDSHASRFDLGYAIFTGSIGENGEVMAVMGENANTWLASETETDLSGLSQR